MSTELFQQIEQLVRDRAKVPGWCAIPKAIALAAAVLTLRPKVSVEIGVFGGSSFFPIAMAHREIGSGVAIGIDPWSNAAASEGYAGEHFQWWGQTVNLEKIYNDFTTQVNALGIGGFVQIHRAKSDDITPPERIDLLHIDGQHTDQAVRDADRFGSKVRVGGLVFCDDITWEGGGVMRSIEKLKAMGFTELYRCDTGAMFQRTA